MNSKRNNKIFNRKRKKINICKSLIKKKNNLNKIYKNNR